MIRKIVIFFYRITGWKVTGFVPQDQKLLLLVAPHTSYWDFPVGYAAKIILQFDAKFLGKVELFKTPVLGWILKKMGGVPVIRDKNNNMVDFVVNLFNTNENFKVVITPEGTRAYVPKWKTGFYHIAKNAGIPIVMCGFDFKKKVVEVKPPFYPTDDFEADMDYIMSYFRGVTGKHPELGVR